ncbi:MAG: 6-bladed beta-propeller [Rikenellaceae bacterium]|jgi:hypothetical protein|nr:6-bladed beta-propeller [Rikenellaceae bacterium]
MKTVCANILIFLAVVCTSCEGRRESQHPSIDVSRDYPKEEISWQAIADVEYVPLAISDDVLLASYDRLFYLSDRFIMIYSISSGDIYIFSRDGEIISHFNRQGRGPNEYGMIKDVVFDENTEEFFVVDIYSSRILVFSLTGKHKRTLTLPNEWQIKAYNFDKEALLVYDDGGVTAGSFKTMPYHLISKADGSIIETLHIDMPQRYSNMIFTNNQVYALGLSNNRLGGGKDFTLADISCDTVYRYTREKVLSPAFVRTPSVHDTEPKTVLTTALVSDRFIVFTITSLDFESSMRGSGFSVRPLMYDYATGSTTEPVFKNDDYPSLKWDGAYNEIDIPANTFAQILDPLELKDAHEKGELSGYLRDIAAEIEEDDNPVVMIMRIGGV